MKPATRRQNWSQGVHLSKFFKDLQQNVIVQGEHPVEVSEASIYGIKCTTYDTEDFKLDMLVVEGARHTTLSWVWRRRMHSHCTQPPNLSVSS